MLKGAQLFVEHPKRIGAALAAAVRFEFCFGKRMEMIVAEDGGFDEPVDFSEDEKRDVELKTLVHEPYRPRICRG